VSLILSDGSYLLTTNPERLFMGGNHYQLLYEEVAMVSLDFLLYIISFKS
jgi:hypothetical protein